MGTGGSFPGGKGTWAWSWPLTSNQCRGQENVDLYIHSPIRLHGVVKHRDNFTFTVSPLYVALVIYHVLLQLASSDVIKSATLWTDYTLHITRLPRIALNLSWKRGISWLPERLLFQKCQLFFFFFFFLNNGSTALVGLGRFFSFLIYSQSVGLLGRVISSSQGLYLNTG
jgi:hypothetical protein